ncbi:MAG: amidohydrolase family protein [Acidimicrobiia bacterium]
MTDRNDDQLPVELGPVSNGEYVPPPQSPALREAERRARDLIDRQSRRRGMSRRDFLRTSMATAAVFIVLDACTSEEHQARTGRKPGGTLALPEETAVDPDAARNALGGDEFVFDLQTHFLEYDLSTPTGNFGSSFPQASCGEADARACFSIDHYLEQVFLRSDTNYAVVSAIPASDNNGPLSTAHMDDARRIADQLCGDGRILMHGQALPALGNLDARLDAMNALMDEYPIAAWKVYTHAPSPWFLDDHDPRVPQVGNAFLDRIRATGVKIVSVHKGFGGGSPYAAPVDIGPAASAHPDIRFVVYHSGYEATTTEGPYHEDGRGVDRLVRTLQDAGVASGANVYAEIGSTWFNVMRDPDQAAHTLGKLLVAVGPDNLVWGTDSIWYGSPQAQIEAFRAFEITREYQEQFGYPALTAELKRKILGVNGATLYGVQPNTARCDFTPDELEQARAALPARPASYGPRTAGAVYAHMADHGWVGF